MNFKGLYAGIIEGRKPFKVSGIQSGDESQKRDGVNPLRKATTNPPTKAVLKQSNYAHTGHNESAARIGEASRPSTGGERSPARTALRAAQGSREVKAKGGCKGGACRNSQL